MTDDDEDDLVRFRAYRLEIDEKLAAAGIELGRVLLEASRLRAENDEQAAEIAALLDERDRLHADVHRFRDQANEIERLRDDNADLREKLKNRTRYHLDMRPRS